MNSTLMLVLGVVGLVLYKVYNSDTLTIWVKGLKERLASIQTPPKAPIDMKALLGHLKTYSDDLEAKVKELSDFKNSLKGQS